MADERIYTIPLRHAYEKERIRRAKKAMTLIREFLEKHMKSEKVKLGKSINEEVWARGAKKPPRKIRIHTVKEDDTVYAELIGIDIKTPTVDEKKAKAKKVEEKKKRVKEAREERKKLSLEEELDESGKVETPEQVDKEAEKKRIKPETKKEKKEEQKPLKKVQPRTK